MIAIFASIIHKHDEIQQTLKICQQHKQIIYAFCCLKIPEGQDGAIFPTQGNGALYENPFIE